MGWLAFEVVSAATRLGSRRDTAMILIAGVLLYDHLVKPLKTWQAVAGGAGLLLGLLAFGFARDLDGATASWTSANEFQILFGNGCDLLVRVRSGQLEIPRQLYFGELLMLIPSRWQPLLPFPVLDPSDWYLDVLDVRGTGVGFMFGVVAQAIIGGDWVSSWPAECPRPVLRRDSPMVQPASAQPLGRRLLPVPLRLVLLHRPRQYLLHDLLRSLPVPPDADPDVGSRRRVEGPDRGARHRGSDDGHGIASPR